MASVDIFGFGHVESVAVTGNKTLAATDSGIVQDVTASCTVTLPAVGATVSGLAFPIRVGKEGITVTISPNSADKIVGNGFTAADDKDMIFTNQPAGSYVVLHAVNEATTDSCYTVQKILGTATRQA